MAFKLNLGTLGLNLSLNDRQFKSAMGGASKLVASFGKMAAKAAAYGVGALSAGLLYAVHSFAKFEQSIMNAAAVSGDGVKAFGQFKAAAMDAAAGSMFSATEAGNALEFLSLAGFSAANSIAALPGVLQLATAAKIELGKATDIATDTLSAFGMKAVEVGRVGDVMAATFSTSNTNMLQLGEAMSYVGPIAKSMKLDIETTSAALGLLADVGNKASLGGTMLRGVLMRLRSPVGKAKTALKKLGVSMYDADGTTRDFVDVIEDLHKATNGLKDDAMGAALSDIFGMRNVLGAETLIASVGNVEKSFRSYRDELRNSQGATRRIAKLMEQTVTGAIKILKGNVENLATQFGQFFGPAIRQVADLLTGLVKRAATSDEGFVKMRNAAVKTINTMGDFVIGVAHMTRAAGGLVGLLGEVAHAFDAMGAGIMVMANGAGLLTATLFGKEGDMDAWADAFVRSQEALDKANSRDFGSFFKKSYAAANDAAEGLDAVAGALYQGALEAEGMTKETVELLKTLDQLDKKQGGKKKGLGGGSKGSKADGPVSVAMGALNFAAATAEKSAVGAAKHMSAVEAAMAAASQGMGKAAAKGEKEMEAAYRKIAKEREKTEKEALKAYEKMMRDRNAAQKAMEDATGDVIGNTIDRGIDVLANVFGEGFGDFARAIQSSITTGMEIYEQTGDVGLAFAAGLADATLSLLDAFTSTEEFQEGVEMVGNAFERVLGKFDPLAFIADQMDAAFGAFILTIESLEPLKDLLDMDSLGEMIGQGLFGAAKNLIWLMLSFGEVMSRISQGFNWLMAAIIQIPMFIANMVNGVIEFFGGAPIIFEGLSDTLSHFENASADAAYAAELLGRTKASLEDMTYEQAQAAYTSEVERSTEAMKDLNDELRNAPSGFKTKLASMRYGVDDGRDVAAGSSGGGGGTTVHINAMGMRASELIQAMERRSILRSGSTAVVESARHSSEYAARRFA